MKTWKLVTVLAASLSAVAFSAACTVEEGDVVGSGGSAGTATQPTAGTGGTPAAAGSGGAAAGAGGAPAASLTYADFFTEEDKADSVCTACIKIKCATENVACGDVFGKGACAAAVTCLTEGITAKPDNYDCSFEGCAASNPQAAVNEAFTCTADKCATECGVTPGFGGCP